MCCTCCDLNLKKRVMIASLKMQLDKAHTRYIILFIVLFASFLMGLIHLFIYFVVIDPVD